MQPLNMFTRRYFWMTKGGQGGFSPSDKDHNFQTNSKVQNGVDSTKEGAQNLGDKIKSAIGFGQEKTAEARDKTADKMREGADKVETR